MIVQLNEETAKKIINYLDDWKLDVEDKSLNDNFTSNYTVTFDIVNSYYTDNFYSSETEINRSYNILDEPDKNLFLIAVYKKTASDLFSLKNINQTDNEENSTNTFPSRGSVLFTEYTKIIDNLRNQSVVYGI